MVHRLDECEIRTLVNCLFFGLMGSAYRKLVAANVPGAHRNQQTWRPCHLPHNRIYRPQWFIYQWRITRDHIASGKIGALGIVEGVPLLLKVSSISNTSSSTTNVRFSLGWSLPVRPLRSKDRDDDGAVMYSRFVVSIASLVFSSLPITLHQDDKEPVKHEEFRSVDATLTPLGSYFDSEGRLSVTVRILSPWNGSRNVNIHDQFYEEDELFI